MLVKFNVEIMLELKSLSGSFIWVFFSAMCLDSSSLSNYEEKVINTNIREEPRQTREMWEKHLIITQS